MLDVLKIMLVIVMFIGYILWTIAPLFIAEVIEDKQGRVAPWVKWITVPWCIFFISLVAVGLTCWGWGDWLQFSECFK